MVAAVTNSGNCYVSPESNREDWTLLKEFQSGLKMSKIGAHKKYALKCKFSPDSTMVATSSADRTAKLWSTHGHDQLHVSRSMYLWNYVCFVRFLCPL